MVRPRRARMRSQDRAWFAATVNFERNPKDMTERMLVCKASGYMSA